MRTIITLLILATLVLPTVAVAGSKPDILFIVIDDTGIDQWASFGWNATGVQRAANTPVLDAITNDGVAFSNCWAMPECSPSRASFFTGRLPMRTNVEAAITNGHLAASQLNDAEIMTPEILKQAGYRCGFSGKWHTGEVPFDEAQPVHMGWDAYMGNWFGFVPGIDTTAGQQLTATLDENHPNGWLPCSTPLGDPDEAANRGPCCLDAQMCVEDIAGVDCLAMGGTPLVELQTDATGTTTAVFQTSCDAGCEAILFGESNDGSLTARNGFFVWGQQWADTTGSEGLINYYHGPMLTDTTDFAMAWLQDVDPIDSPSQDPWYLALQYNTAHDPIMPTSLRMVERMEADGIDTAAIDCGSIAGIKTLFPYMIEEADLEIGRLLEARGLGSYAIDGTFQLADLEAANTVIAWIGDNGTFYSSTRLPFNPLLSKATVYQTGVWVPLAVAGAGVATGQVDYPVNAVDLFALFAELADVDLDAVMPASHVLDAHSLAPYLQNPNAPAVRTFNYAQSGTGVFNPFDPPQACTFAISGGVCDDIHFAGEGLCLSNGGVWHGVDSSDPNYPIKCCDLYENPPADWEGDFPAPAPDKQITISMMDDTSAEYRMWKLNVFQPASCDTSACVNEIEFYRLPHFITPHFAALDNPDGPHRIALPEDPATLQAVLSSDEYNAFMTMACKLQSQWASAARCQADGTIDGMVNIDDVFGVITWWSGDQEQLSFFDTTGKDSVPDGMVNINDLLLVLASWSGDSTCTPDFNYVGSTCLLEYVPDCP
jgi:hypothetical protein